MLLAHSNSGEMVNELLGNICALMNTLFFAIYMTLQVSQSSLPPCWFDGGNVDACPACWQCGLRITDLSPLLGSLQKKYLFAPMASLATPWRSKPTYVTAWSYLFGAVFMLVGGLVAWAAGLNFMGFGRNGALCSPSNATLVCNPNANLTTSYCDVATHKCRLLTDTFALSTATIGPLIYAVFGEHWPEGSPSNYDVQVDMGARLLLGGCPPGLWRVDGGGRSEGGEEGTKNHGVREREGLRPRAC